MLQAMNTGHDGSMGTIHANSPRECLNRMESMIAMGGFSPIEGFMSEADYHGVVDNMHLPSGALFAIQLLLHSKRANLELTVTIIDKKIVQHSGKSPCHLEGCNYCAGIISPRLHNALGKSGRGF